MTGGSNGGAVAWSLAALREHRRVVRRRLGCPVAQARLRGRGAMTSMKQLVQAPAQKGGPRHCNDHAETQNTHCNDIADHVARPILM